jgi:hypothetical protein
MALNPNHAFEDLEGVKCSIVEKNCTQERADFLKALLAFNKFTVQVVKSPPPKVAPPKPAPPLAEGEVPPAPAIVVTPPTTFTVGVTDLSFNPISAVYNKELQTPGKQFVDVKYWKQELDAPSTQKWYWEQ